MNLNVWFIIGVGISFCGFYQAMSRKSREGLNSYEYFLKSDKDHILDNVKQIVSTLLYPGGYFLIIFSSKTYLQNIIIIVILNFIIYPPIWGIVEGIRQGKRLNNFFRQKGITR